MSMSTYVLIIANEVYRELSKFNTELLSDGHYTCFMQHKCDLINMSYGEPALLPDYGRFVDLVNEVSTQNLLHLV